MQSMLKAFFLGILVFAVVAIAVPLSAHAQQVDICTAPFYSVSPALTDLGLNSYQRLTTINPSTYLPTTYTGGLYPNGSNYRPAGHEVAGQAIAQTIQPLNAQGVPDPNGKIGMGSIGMSNTNGEFQVFMSNHVNNVINTTANDKLKVVNTAAPGAVMEFWVNPTLPQYNNIWNYWVSQRLSQVGLTPEQMQVFWVKVTDTETDNFTFPAGTETLTDYYVMLMHEIQTRFPNVKAVYFSSRTRSYAYFQGLSPEPVAFENGFAVKWLIERQLNGDPELNYNPNVGPVTSPYISWGPYVWIDGENTRSDGMQWFATDLRADCVHPSASGNAKVAQMLWNFFSTDSTTVNWFLDPGTTPPENAAPNVYVGANASIYLSNTLSMHATVSDDGLPTGSQVAVNWVVDYGPGNVTMTNWASKDTDISFDTVGTYQLTLTATDTLLTSQDSIVVTVAEDIPNQPPVAQNSNYTTDNDEWLTFSLPFTDPDVGDIHTFNIVDYPATGSLQQEDGNVTYIPDGVSTGDITFTWTVSDTEYTSNVAIATITLVQPPVIEEDLISYLDFSSSGQLVDLLNPCVGCSINGATWGPQGIADGNYSFDGINDYLNLSTYLYLDNLTDFTYSLWVKPGFSNTNTTQKYLVNNFQQFGIQYLPPINDWRVSLRVNGSNKTVDTVGATWATDTWHLLTVTYDGVIIRVYWDGIQSGSKAASGAVSSSSNPMHIGGYVGQPVYFNGSIDEIKIYNRALSPTEVLEKYQAQ